MAACHGGTRASCHLAAAVEVMSGNLAPDRMGPVATVAFLLFLWPSIVGPVKRLHDLNLSGWILAAVYPGGFLVGLLANVVNEDLALSVMVLLGASMLALTVALGFMPGTKGPNRYGDREETEF